MRREEFADFRELLTGVMAYYGKDASAFMLDLWWRGMAPFSLAQVNKAFARHSTDPERGAFAPKISDVVRVLSGTATDRAALAWGKVHEAMSTVGAYTDVVFDDPAIHAAVEDLGGWPKLCRTDLKDLGYAQHRFQEAHRAYTESGNFSFPSRLGGDRATDSEYQKFGQKPPEPVLIGAPEQAMAVMKGGTAQRTAISTVSQAVKALGLSHDSRN